MSPQGHGEKNSRRAYLDCIAPITGIRVHSRVGLCRARIGNRWSTGNTAGVNRKDWRPGERFIEGLLWGQKVGPRLFGDPEGIATRMPVPLGKPNGKLLHAGLPHGNELLPFALRHLCLFVERALEFRFEIGRSDGVLRLAPLGLPLCPGLNWCSFGGRPGPTLYSPSADGQEALLGIAGLLSEPWV
jgi:hypothetical protein